MLKLLMKQAGFLLLMLVLGILAVVAFERGYPLAWRVGSEQWIATSVVLNLLLMAAGVAGVFFLLRGFLFGRGRPWLAGVSALGWVAVFAVVVPFSIGGRTAMASGPWALGHEAMRARVDAAREQPWSAAEVAALPAAERVKACETVFDNERGGYATHRDGIAVNVLLPQQDEERSTFLEGQACPDPIKAQFVEWKRLKEAQANSVQKPEEPGSDAGELTKVLYQAEVAGMIQAQVTMLGHPDTIERMAEIRTLRKEKLIEGVLESNRLQLRLMRNGQYKEHEWVEIPEFSTTTGGKVYYDPRIWNAGSDAKSDEWYFWTQVRERDGETVMHLRRADCKRLSKVEVVATIEAKDQTSKLKPFIDAFGTFDKPHGPDSFLYTANKLACASKSKQARLSEETPKAGS